MMTWDIVPLGELIQFRNGKSIKPGGDGPYVVFGSNGVIGNSEKYLYSDAIILGRVGAYCGSVAYCPDAFWASDNTIVVEPKDDIFDTRFAYYALTHANLSHWAGGAAQPLITQTVLKGVPIAVPPLYLQRRIAGILSAYDDLIEVNTRRIAILEEMARRLFDEWFLKLEVSRLPDGWRRVCLDDLVEEIRDTVLPSELPAETPYIGLEHMPRRSITLRSWGRASEVGSTKHRFQKADILFGKIRPYFHKVVIAPFPGVASSDAIVMRPVDDVMGAVAACLTSSDAFVAHAVQTSNGTKMPRANWNVLRKYEIALPPPAMLRRFAETVAPAFNLSSIFAESCDRLRAARDLLLPKLISGEIDLDRAGRETPPIEQVAAK